MILLENVITYVLIDLICGKLKKNNILTRPLLAIILINLKNNAYGLIGKPYILCLNQLLFSFVHMILYSNTPHMILVKLEN